MGTITGQQIADRAWTKALEQTGSSATRWTPTEALWWINDAQREVVHQLPKAYTKAVTATAVAGNVRQTLAGLSITDGLTVVDVTRNYSADGNTSGPALTKRERAMLDELDPEWPTTRAQTNAVHWMFDERDPKAFYIYPPKASGRLEVVYSAAPPDLASLARGQQPECVRKERTKQEQKQGR